MTTAYEYLPLDYEHAAQQQSSKLQLARVMIYTAAALAFMDESIRKTIPGEPVEVTAIKDFCLMVAGLVIVMSRQFTFLTRHLMLFVPWSVFTFLSSLYVAYTYDAPNAVPAVFRTYSAAPLYFAVGYYLAADQALFKRVAKIVGFGIVMSILVAFAQETMRGALPFFLAKRIYKAKNDSAGGLYVESLFASPQILAQVVTVLMCWMFTRLLAPPPNARSRLLFPVTLFLLCWAAIFITRIRIAVALGVLMIGMIVLIIPRAGVNLGRLGLRLLGGGGLILAALFLGMALGPDNPFDLKSQQDKKFFTKLLIVEENTKRLLFFTGEIERIDGYEHSKTLGFGAGTGGTIRNVIGDYRLLAVPIVHDTGIALVYHEMGVLGGALFVLCYIVLPIQVILRMSRRQVPLVVVPALTIVVAFTGWFLFKAHPVMMNGLSHSIWLIMMGICFGAIDTQQQQQQQSGHASHEPHVDEYGYPIHAYATHSYGDYR